MISPKFIKSSFLYTISGSFPLVASFVLLPFYTNYLSTSNYGQLALYINFSIIVQLFTSFNVDTVLYLFHPQFKGNDQERKVFYGSINSILFLLGIATGILFAIAGVFIFPWLIKDTSSHYYWLGISSVLISFLTSYFRVYGHVLVLHERPISYFIINLLNLVLTIGISIAGVLVFKDSIIGPMLGRIFSFLGVFLLCAFLFSKEFGFVFSRSVFREIFANALPILGYNIVLIIAGSLVDLYILNPYISKGQLGTYDLSVKCAIGVEFIISSLWTASTPRITHLLDEMTEKKSNEKFNRYFNVLSTLLVVLSSLMLIIVPPVVLFLVKRPDYYKALQIFPLVTLMNITKVLTLYFIVTIYYFRKNSRLILSYSILSILKIIISIPLAARFGITGFIGSVYISKVLEVIALYVTGKDLFSYRFNFVKIIFFPVLFFSSTLAIYYFTEESNHFAFYIFQFIALSLISLYMYRKELWISAERYLFK